MMLFYPNQNSIYNSNSAVLVIWSLFAGQFCHVILTLPVLSNKDNNLVY